MLSIVNLIFREELVSKLGLPLCLKSRAHSVGTDVPQDLVCNVFLFGGIKGAARYPCLRSIAMEESVITL